MCLYPKFIKNKKYLPNKKNNYNPPTPTDYRTTIVPVGCGNCIECRQQKAREWQTRLHEEIKIHKCKYFVTLTFSEENFTKLCKELKTETANIIAAKAVRRFLERWRKKYKKSVTHWLITELGHTNTERLHLHGLIFTEEPLTLQELQNIWQYGIADNGQYVNERTINYIVKYVTKIDNDHKGYIPQIFCSSGIGRSFCNTIDFQRRKYNGTNTIEYYTLNNGAKVNLPIYYRNKLYTEEQREQLWLQKLDKQETYVRGLKMPLKTDEDINRYNEVLKQQQEENKRLGYGDDSKEWQRKDYNVTLRRLNVKQRLQEYIKNSKK